MIDCFLPWGGSPNTPSSSMLGPYVAHQSRSRGIRSLAEASSKQRGIQLTLSVRVRGKWVHVCRPHPAAAMASDVGDRSVWFFSGISETKQTRLSSSATTTDCKHFSRFFLFECFIEMTAEWTSLAHSCAESSKQLCIWRWYLIWLVYKSLFTHPGLSCLLSPGRLVTSCDWWP